MPKSKPYLGKVKEPKAKNQETRAKNQDLANLRIFTVSTREKKPKFLVLYL